VLYARHQVKNVQRVSCTEMHINTSRFFARYQFVARSSPLWHCNYGICQAQTTIQVWGFFLLTRRSHIPLQKGSVTQHKQRFLSRLLFLIRTRELYMVRFVSWIALIR